MSCGETSEKVAALAHGAVSALYVVMLIFHLKSVLTHWNRREEAPVVRQLRSA